jgi:agmatine deiminase
MPGEWEKHSSILLAWPHNKEDWPGKFAPIPWVYAEIIRHITRNERISLIVRSEKEKEQAIDICSRAGADVGKIDFYIIPTNRIWMRDSGPIIVKAVGNGQQAIVNKKTTNAQSPKLNALLDFRFTAWAKYPNHKLDDKVPSALNESWGMERVQPMHKGKRIVLEGGAIDVNGKGTLITTEECLLSDVQARNPGFTRKDYEEVFAKYLGISQIIWLGNGIVGDDTHGHVDDITRFVNAGTVVTVVEKDKNDENYSLLKDNVKRLKAARDQSGKQLNIVELPMPRPVIFEGQRLPASYANFLICNGVVLVPTFNDPADRVALNILAELFPKREVVGIHAVDLVWGLGTIHCMSQQIPE